MNVIRYAILKKSIGKIFISVISVYLLLYLNGCSPPRPSKPPTSIARAMETKQFNFGHKEVLKSSINSLQDMNYTIDVLNSDMGLITASRTTEMKMAELDMEDENQLTTLQKVAIFAGIIVAVGSFFALIDHLFGGGESDEDEDEEPRFRKTNSHYSYHSHNETEFSPEIYRYKVTINLNNVKSTVTEVRVSASGEVEKDGSILQTGGIHEPEFFQMFFTNIENSLVSIDQ
tara:strand:+ start:298 stop:990 length:693 start_codon:yes stop_codon:yes gene_type:complete